MSDHWPITLTDFLSQRIAEDEVMARDAATDPRHSWIFVDFGGRANYEHGHRFDPTRVLAECEVKRGLLALHPTRTSPDGTAHCACQEDPRKVRGVEPCETKALLLGLYSDHPDSAWMIRL